MDNPKPQRRQIRLDPEVYSQPGAVALLTTCTANRNPTFKHIDHTKLIMSEISHLHDDDSRVLGFCIMPDHVHLLLLNLRGSLLDSMRVFKGRTARLLRGHGVDHLWQRSFHDHFLRRNEDISATLQYLLENPERADLVNCWTDYPWCGSLQWPEIDHEFFNVRPADVVWAEIFPLEETDSKADPGPGRG